MTAAERRAALFADGEQAATLTDRLLLGILVEFIGLRDDLARREQRRLESAGAISARPDTARPASAPASANGAVFPSYGRKKGEPVTGADMGDLTYYLAGCVRSLADPEKSRWHAKERALKTAIEAEIKRQGGGGEPAGNEFGPPDDDDIPF